MDLTQHDMEEMKMAAEKAMLKASPHARKLVAIDAEKLLWLIARVQEEKEMRAELDKIHEDAEECTCTRVPPYDGCAVHE